MASADATGYALRFDAMDFAAYDLFILERKTAGGGLFPKTGFGRRALASMPCRRRRRDRSGTDHHRRASGAEASYNRETLAPLIAEYQGVTAAELRANLVAFLREVVPVAEEAGIRLAIHPDDPPWPLFGLPRVVSTAEDVRAILRGLRYAGQRFDVLCRVLRSAGR
jgi:mannonate dehydratase